jgi:hypothetical protein
MRRVLRAPKGCPGAQSATALEQAVRDCVL